MTVLGVFFSLGNFWIFFSWMKSKWVNWKLPVKFSVREVTKMSCCLWKSKVGKRLFLHVPCAEYLWSWYTLSSAFYYCLVISCFIMWFHSQLDCISQFVLDINGNFGFCLSEDQLLIFFDYLEMGVKSNEEHIAQTYPVICYHCSLLFCHSYQQYGHWLLAEILLKTCGFCRIAWQ